MFEIDEKAVSDAVSFTPREEAAPAPLPPPPPPMPVVPSAPPPPPEEVAIPKPAAPSVSVGGDLPVAALAVPLLAAFAAATFFMRERVDEEASSSSSAPAPAPAAASPSPAPAAGGVDVSIPYDAAAKLAYEKSDKSMEYADFKEKFEADAVADVIAKKG